MRNDFPVTSLWQEGIFETMRSEKRKIVALEQHLDRLFESAHSIGLSLGHSRTRLKRLLEKEIASTSYPDATLRIAFLREGRKSRLFWIVKEAKRYPASLYKKGVSIRTSPVRRNAVSALDAQIKVKDYLNGLLATLDAGGGDSFEEIYLDAEGYITEGRISNIFMVKDEILFTPPTFLGVLRGITRDQTIREAKGLPVSVHEEPFTRFNLYGADEAFLTNTSMGVMPVVSVDGRKIGNEKVGGMTERLMNALRAQEGSRNA